MTIASRIGERAAGERRQLNLWIVKMFFRYGFSACCSLSTLLTVKYSLAESVNAPLLSVNNKTYMLPVQDYKDCVSEGMRIKLEEKKKRREEGK
jgi:hypothetical protein